MITANETKYDYEFKENDRVKLKISKKAWERIHEVGLDKPLVDGNATFIFRKNNFGILINKKFNGKNFSESIDNISWQYIKDWVRCHDKRKELTEEYIKNMSPEEIKKRNIARFKTQFETPEYKASMEKRRIEYEKKWAEECKQSRILAQEKEKARQEMIEKIHNDIMSGACELPFYEG